MEKNFTITKDFGNKTLNKVFVKEEDAPKTTNPSLYFQISSALNACETVCVVAETAFSQKLMKLLYDERQGSEFRIYGIVKNLQPSAFEQLKNNCIIREVPSISGNYLICGDTRAFFFDENLEGYSVTKPESVKKLRDIFIYEFWNHAKKEFVSEIKPVAEQTFDVAPVEGSETILIDRSALETKPYQKCLDNAECYAAQKNLPDWIKNKANENSFIIYIVGSPLQDKTILKNSKDWLFKISGGKIKYAESPDIPLCRYNGDWYILNNDLNKADNTGNFFAVKMENEPVFTNVYLFKNSITYREASGKDIFNLDNSKVSVAERNREETRKVTYDYKKYRAIEEMNKNDREEFFEKENLLNSNKPAVEVTFDITMEVKKRTPGANPAPVYAEYEDFNKQRNPALTELDKNISKYSEKIKELTAEIENFNEQEDGKKNDGKKLDKLNNELSVAQEVYKELIRTKKTAESLPENPETVEYCRLVKETLAKFNNKLKLPSFDKPRYGTLYKAKNSLEYALKSASDLDAAEKEMDKEEIKKAGIKDVEFVEQS
ncbi:hypothetical protein J6Z39_01315 [bacterium]|nr:hypothetical protein [bacterium]MBP5434438.1 hypothetical protein [bacterium]